MSSSYGNVVGTPRDEIPDISKTNYDRTSPNLDESIAKNIDTTTQNVREESRRLERILEEQRTLPDLLRLVDETLGKVVQFRDASEKKKKAVEYINEAEASRLDAAGRLQKKKEAEELAEANAKLEGTLINEYKETNNVAALDFYNATVASSDKTTLRKFGEDLFPQLTGGLTNHIEEKGFNGVNTMNEGVEIYDQGFELMTTSLLYHYEEAGYDIDSKEFKDEWNQVIYPKLLAKKQRDLLSLERKLAANADTRNDKAVSDDISNILQNATPGQIDTLKTDKMISTIKIRYGFPDTPQGDKDALLKLFSIVSESVRTGDGAFTPADLNTLEDEMLFFEKSSGTYKTFEDLKIGGPKDQTKQAITNANLKARDAYNVDPTEEKNIRYNDFITNTIEPVKEKYRELGIEVDPGEIMVLQKKFKQLFPGEPVPTDILNLQSKQFTSSKYGSYPNAGQPTKYASELERVERAYIDNFNALPENEGKIKITRASQLPGDHQILLSMAKGDLIEGLDLGLANESGRDKRITRNEVTSQIIKNIGEQKYKIADVKNEAEGVTLKDAIAYSEEVKAEPTLIDSKKAINVQEKAVLSDSLNAILDGDFARVSGFWDEIAKRDKRFTSGYDVAVYRLLKTGGLRLDENSGTYQIVRDRTYYDLSKEDRLILANSPNDPAKFGVFYFNKDKTKSLLNSMRSTEMVDGELEYVPDGRYYLTRANGTVVVRNDGENRSANQLLKYYGSDNFGRYGLSRDNLLTIKRYQESKGIKLLDFNAKFDENFQTNAAAILMKIGQSTRNDIRGLGIANDKGVYSLPGISEDDRKILSTVFEDLYKVDFSLGWDSHSDALNSLFIGEAEKATIANKEYVNSIVTQDMFRDFLVANKDKERVSAFSPKFSNNLRETYFTDTGLVDEDKITDFSDIKDLDLRTSILDFYGLRESGDKIIPKSTKKKRRN
jgi:hypothetical protein|tara:strand:- start:2408 stop:5251 length:2844 start_codon:yes stop_codon:yes gene_type:complete